jgi:hypothetical protein
MKKKIVPILFWVLVAAFIIVFSSIIFGFIRGVVFLPAIGVFALLGLALFIFTFREKYKGWMKKSLLVTGGSVVLFVISVFLHNFFYALGIIFSHITFLKYLMEFLHVGFFLIGLIV